MTDSPSTTLMLAGTGKTGSRVGVALTGLGRRARVEKGTGVPPIRFVDLALRAAQAWA